MAAACHNGALRPAAGVGLEQAPAGGYPGAGWVAFAVLAPAIVVSPLFVGLLGPLAIAVYATVISVPAWIVCVFMRCRRDTRR